ncbi:MAG: hypothetical protein QM703_29615 [Gemmatales bacterium]
MNQGQSWEEQKLFWTNRFVTADSTHPPLRRFVNLTGRVVTVNGSMMCLVDFQDGAWYDISPQFLNLCPDQAEAAKRYSAGKNSAQAVPHRQA